MTNIYNFPQLTQEDITKLISYFESRQKDIIKLVNTPPGKYWYAVADDYYRGFYNALGESLNLLRIQKQKARRE